MMPRPVQQAAPLDTIAALCRDCATGELICVADDAEVHVYMQCGRIAWATSSQSRFVFSRELIDRCNLDRDAFKELLEECRRNHRPLGETIVSWGLATKDQVREALELQVNDALATLAEHATGSTIFLERGTTFEHYDSELTFDGAGLLAGLKHEPPAQPDWPQEKTTAGTSLARRLVDEVPGVLWSQVGATEGAASGMSRDRASRNLPQAAWTSLGQDLCFAAVRSGRGTALGFADAVGAKHVWVGLDADEPLGISMAALAGCFTHPVFRQESRSSKSPVADLHAVGDACPDCAPELRELFDRSPETTALAVLEGGKLICALGRRGHDLRALVEHGVRHVALMELGRSSAFDADSQSAESIGFYFASMALRTRDHWHFAAEITDASGRLVWLVLEETASQGLGWALVTSVNRLLASRPCCGPSEAGG